MTTKRKKPNALTAVSDLALSAHKRLTILEGDVARLMTPPAAEAKPSDADIQDTNGFDEEFLVGLWVADQRRAGATTIDLEKVEHVREGMRYALEMRSPV